jgi:hypothetical protein
MTETLISKLNKAMQTMGNVAKSGKMNEGGKNYSYMQADDIFGKLQDALADAGIAIIPNITHANFTDVVSKSGSTGRHVVIDMEFQITDGTDSFRSGWISEAIDYGDKAITKAGTLGRKYFIISLFQLATGDSKDDPDSDNQEGSRVSRSGTAEKQPSPKSEPKQEPLPKGEPTDDKRPLDPVALMKKLVITQEKVPPASEKQVKLVARMLTEHCENEQDSDQLKEWLFGVPSTKEADPQMVNAVLKWLNIGEDWQVGKYVQSEINNVLDYLKQ